MPPPLRLHIDGTMVYLLRMLKLQDEGSFGFRRTCGVGGWSVEDKRDARNKEWTPHTQRCLNEWPAPSTLVALVKACHDVMRGDMRSSILELWPLDVSTRRQEVPGLFSGGSVGCSPSATSECLRSGGPQRTTCRSLGEWGTEGTEPLRERTSAIPPSIPADQSSRVCAGPTSRTSAPIPHAHLACG